MREKERERERGGGGGGDRQTETGRQTDRLRQREIESIKRQGRSRLQRDSETESTPETDRQREGGRGDEVRDIETDCEKACTQWHWLPETERDLRCVMPDVQSNKVS